MKTKIDSSLDYANFFRKALALASEGKYQVEPNPMVGALVLEKDQIVGKGYHRHYGGHHAEIEAFHDAKGRGDTLLVTLEPCSTQGKTPPCVWSIVQSKIKRIIVGAVDPHPKHQGSGIEILRQSGREVIQVDFQKEWEEQNGAFLKYLRSKRPWVIAKWAMTLDGKIASASGDSKWVSSEHAREEVWKLRGRCEAIATGVGTVFVDDPLLTPREHQTLANPPLRVIFDSTLETGVDSQVVTNKDAKTLFITTSKASKASEKMLTDAGCEVFRAKMDGTRISIQAALEELRERGVRRLLLEGGSRLTASFFEQGCVDQAQIYLAPKFIGGEKALSPIAGEGIEKMTQALPLRDWKSEAVGQDLRITGFL